MKTRVVVALAIALVTTLSCFSDRDPTTPTVAGDCSVPLEAFGRNRAVVIIRNFSFLADTVRIRSGGTVTWVNCEPATVEPHTSTSETDVWSSGLIVPGSSYARTFATTGAFPYFCEPHPSMRGVVIVE